MRRLAPPVAAVCVAVGLIALFRLVQRWDPSAAMPIADAEQMAMTAHRAVMISRAAGQTDWRLNVDRIVLRKARDGGLTDFHAAEFSGVREGLVYDDGRRAASFSARSATYEKLTKRLDVQSGIRFRSADGDAFAAERCIWTERDEYARFPEGAKATILGDTVTAPNMLYSTRTRLVQCPDGAEGVFRGRRISARAMEWDSAARTVRCTGPITGRSGDMSFIAQYAELNLAARTIRVNKGALDLRIDSRKEMNAL
ncbi:MAG: hypothetical protein FJX72_01330 [Armatimonadetes bacterium]|nr:hypothetical protein [Armatimonadota bacterium]